MARARSIKPGFFKNEELADLGLEAMLLYAGLWTLADREGRMEDRPKRIRAEIFPYHAIEIDAILNSLHEHGFIVRYSVDGARYIAIPTWNRHQNPHVKEAASTIPAQCEHHASTVQAPDEHSSSRASFLTPSSLTPDSLNPVPRNGLNPPRPKEREFLEFRSAIEETGAKWSGPDWDEAYSFGWIRLDFEQKLAAVKGIRDRQGTGDYALNAKPLKYLDQRLWERSIKREARQKPPPTETLPYAPDPEPTPEEAAKFQRQYEANMRKLREASGQ